jgi:hypothetical protein
MDEIKSAVPNEWGAQEDYSGLVDIQDALQAERARADRLAEGFEQLTIWVRASMSTQHAEREHPAPIDSCNKQPCVGHRWALRQARAALADSPKEVNDGG